MRLSASWLVLVCLSVAGCSDDDNGQSEEAVVSADASTEDSDKDSDSKKSSGSGGKAGSGRSGNGGAGGSKSASSSGSSDKGSEPDSKGDDEKKDESKESKPSEGDKGKDSEGDKEGDKEKSEEDKPAGSETSGGSESDTSKPNEPTTGGSTPAATGDQLSVCSRSEGDCNQGLACRAPAGPFSAGRGFCSKICRQDEDCSGLAPEGSKYVCSDGPGVSTCELACSGAEDASCPSAMACVQTGVRRGCKLSIRNGLCSNRCASPASVARRCS